MLEADCLKTPRCAHNGEHLELGSFGVRLVTGGVKPHAVCATHASQNCSADLALRFRSFTRLPAYHLEALHELHSISWRVLVRCARVARAILASKRFSYAVRVIWASQTTLLARVVL